MTIDGKRIRQDVWKGKLNQSTNKSLQEIMQPRPSERIWTKWRRILRQLVGTDEHGRLAIPMPLLKCSRWRWFWCRDTQKVFEVHSINEVYVWTQLRQNARRLKRHSPRFGNRQRKIDGVTEEVQAITIQYCERECVIESIQSTVGGPDLQEVEHNIRDHITFTQIGSEEILKQAFLQGTLIAVSDGSDKRESAPWHGYSLKNWISIRIGCKEVFRLPASRVF